MLRVFKLLRAPCQHAIYSNASTAEVVMLSVQQNAQCTAKNTYWTRRSPVTRRQCTTAETSLLLLLDTMFTYAVAVQLLNAYSL